MLFEILLESMHFSQLRAIDYYPNTTFKAFINDKVSKIYGEMK